MAKLEIPRLGPLIPRRGWRFGRALGRLVMRVSGWSFRGDVPNVAKAVIIVAPHTSNWDFPIGAAAMLATDLELRFLGKHTLFSGPLGWLMRTLGGIPVDRSRGAGVVDDMAELFANSDQLLLALSPEGTRSEVQRWKSGFHRIARAAEVPIVAVALDYGPRQIHFGPVLVAGDDLEADIAVFRDFFGTALPKR
jgi:1-acyl-sn-glycerol-3-phosphate acyltransferase